MRGADRARDLGLVDVLEEILPRTRKQSGGTFRFNDTGL